jgi:shikimate kinase
MNLRLKRTPGIYLVGFMGSGKSTVGRALAERLGWSFIDVDAEIERAQHASIAEIFAARGEEEFRRIESEAILRLVQWVERGRPSVVALGGGAFSAAGNREPLLQNGVTVWLDCPFEVARKRAASDPSRPLSRDPDQFRALFEARLPVYALAQIRVSSADDDPAVAVEAIVAHPMMR